MDSWATVFFLLWLLQLSFQSCIFPHFIPEIIPEIFSICLLSILTILLRFSKSFSSLFFWLFPIFLMICWIMSDWWDDWFGYRWLFFSLDCPRRLCRIFPNSCRTHSSSASSVHWSPLRFLCRPRSRRPGNTATACPPNKKWSPLERPIHSAPFSPVLWPVPISDASPFRMEWAPDHKSLPCLPVCWPGCCWRSPRKPCTTFRR